jgi:hypothetical protein
MALRKNVSRKFQAKTNQRIKLGSLLLIMIAVGVVGVKLLSPSHAATVMPLQGVYFNNFSNSTVTNYENTFLGHKVDVAEVFNDGAAYFDWNQSSQV